jgi:hypothetical protein
MAWGCQGRILHLCRHGATKVTEVSRLIADLAAYSKGSACSDIRNLGPNATVRQRTRCKQVNKECVRLVRCARADSSDYSGSPPRHHFELVGRDQMGGQLYPQDSKLPSPDACGDEFPCLNTILFNIGSSAGRNSCRKQSLVREHRLARRSVTDFNDGTSRPFTLAIHHLK